MGVDHLSPSTPLDNQARAKTRLRAFAKTRLCVFVPRESPRRAWLCSFSRRRSLSDTQGVAGPRRDACQCAGSACVCVLHCPLGRTFAGQKRGSAAFLHCPPPRNRPPPLQLPGAARGVQRPSNSPPTNDTPARCGALPRPVAHLLCNYQELLVVLDGLGIVPQRSIRDAYGISSPGKSGPFPPAKLQGLIDPLE